MKRGLAAAAFAVLLVGLATYVAGEQTEVARLRTFDADGAVHETKLWVVDHADSAWVRVANPQRHWYRRLLANPRAELVRGGVTQAVLAEPSAEASVRAAVDGAFREKYGLVDWWYGVLLRRDPIPIRLRPAAAPGAGAN